MTVTYTLHNKDEVKSGEIIMKKSSFSGGDPIVSGVHHFEIGNVIISQVTIANMCAKDARSLLKFVGRVWAGTKIYKNNDSGEIRVCIPNVESPKKQSTQKDKTFDNMVRDIGWQNDMFNVIAATEAHICGSTSCKNCAFCVPYNKTTNECLALKYTNYRDKVSQAFKEIDNV